MKPTYLVIFIFLGLFSCNTNSFQGTYECPDCLYTELNFKQDGTVEILAGGIKAQGEFEVEEKKITVSTETSEYVFMMKDDKTLEGQEDAEGTYIKK